MQHNSNQNKTSNLIRKTEALKKKAKRRLIGSIFLLLIALIILLNVTAKIKPVEVNPKIISINNKQNNIIESHESDLNQPHIINNVVDNIESKIFESTEKIISSSESGNGFKAQLIVNKEFKEQKNNQNESLSKPINKLRFNSQIVSDTVNLKPDPDDILNGNIHKNVTKKYYIQLVASKDKNKILTLQAKLAIQKIKTIIQSFKSSNGVLYRLRIGPFNDRLSASNELTKINSR